MTNVDQDDYSGPWWTEQPELLYAEWVDHSGESLNPAAYFFSQPDSYVGLVDLTYFMVVFVVIIRILTIFLCILLAMTLKTIQRSLALGLSCPKELMSLAALVRLSYPIPSSKVINVAHFEPYGANERAGMTCRARHRLYRNFIIPKFHWALKFWIFQLTRSLNCNASSIMLGCG